MNTVDETLKERGANYGDYLSGVQDRAAIMNTLIQAHSKAHQSIMSAEAQGMLWDIVNKLCRLAITPDHIDSWHDIQGYAKLAEEAVSPPPAIADIDKEYQR